MTGGSNNATKADLAGVRDELKTEIAGVRDELKTEIAGVRDELKTEIAGVRDELKTDIASVRDELKSEIAGVRDELKADIRAVGVMVERLDSKIIALSEGFSATASKTDLHELDVRLSGRIAFLHDVVRSMADDVRKNTKETRQLRSDIAKLRLRFDRRDHRGLERRVTQVEKRVGIR